MADAPRVLAEALADRYRLEREVGAGGMATVYLAEDVKHRRRVAVKVLRPELAASLGPQRFLREIEIAAQLSHPHVLPLLDSGQIPTDQGGPGFLYYVMPFVDGESLRQRLAREGALPIGEAVRLLGEVTDALAHAHRRGVVHRDIKPDNVMLAERHALVTDFGVAKAVSEATGKHEATSVGMALGTPTYMAPEQASADPSLDHRADLYAIGAMAYEMLTGRPPFIGDSAQQVLVAHLTKAPEPPSAHRAGIPPALEQAVSALPREATRRPLPDGRRAAGGARADSPLGRRLHADQHAPRQGRDAGGLVWPSRCRRRRLRGRRGGGARRAVARGARGGHARLGHARRRCAAGRGTAHHARDGHAWSGSAPSRWPRACIGRAARRRRRGSSPGARR